MLAKAGDRHLVDSGGYGWQWDFADACITDVSAVAYDWLATGKPLLITEPAPSAYRPPSQLLDAFASGCRGGLRCAVTNPGIAERSDSDAAASGSRDTTTSAMSARSRARSGSRMRSSARTRSNNRHLADRDDEPTKCRLHPD